MLSESGGINLRACSDRGFNPLGIFSTRVINQCCLLLPRKEIACASTKKCDSSPRRSGNGGIRKFVQHLKGHGNVDLRREIKVETPHTIGFPRGGWAGQCDQRQQAELQEANQAASCKGHG